MVNRLAGPLAKVERAKEHIRDLEMVHATFFEGEPYKVFEKEDSQTRERVWTVRVCSSPPTRLALLAGDAVHNLRSALDYLAYQLVDVNGGRPTKDTGFPVLPKPPVSPQNLEASVRRKVDGASKAAIQVIASLKPYPGGSQPLCWLHDLDIHDKHHLLIVTGSAYHSLVLDFGKALVPEGGVSMTVGLRPADRFPVQDGQEVLRTPPRTGEPIDQMHDDVKFTFEVAFAEPPVVQGEPLVPTLHQLTGFVEQTLQLFTTLL